MSNHRIAVQGRFLASLLIGCLPLASCDPVPTATERDIPSLEAALSPKGAVGLVSNVRRLAARRGATPLPPPPHVRPALVELGQALLFDPILSGGRDISCMTCHHPTLATGDGRQLAIGQGATGLGSGRVHPDGVFIPRNSPPLFNLHVFDHLFWDGRVFVSRGGKLHTPAGDQITDEMERVMRFGALSAQPCFPVESRSEMRGFLEEAHNEPDNELLSIPDGNFAAVWSALMGRLGAIPEYVDMFEAAYPGTRFEDMTFCGHASNAMAGFFADQLFFDDSPWDRFLRGDEPALAEEQLEGAQLFFSIPCSICHGGPAFTDDEFHNVMLAQLGPGTADGPQGNDDFGREKVTGDPAQRYAFRSTPLRNVDLTGPYGHAGEYASLRDFIDHYSENEQKLRDFEMLHGAGLDPLLQGTMLHNFDEILATRDPLIAPVVLTDEQVDILTAFMLALTDERARDLSHLTPASVPSGLPVAGVGSN